MAKATQAAPSEAAAFSDCVVDHHRLVNNPNLFPDVFFNVDDKYQLSAHYFVLKMRLPQLLEDGPGIKKKKQKKKEAHIFLDLPKDQHITHEALERVLVFAYCGSINYTTFSPFKAVEVMRAALVFKIPRLLALSSKYLQEALTMDNIFRLLKFSDSMDMNEAKDICIDFALQSPDFFTSANAEDLGFKLYQEVTALLLKHHQNPDKKKGLMKIDMSAEDTIARDFKHIYGSTEVTGDIMFSIRGEEIRAHKAVLGDQSEEFGSLIQHYEANKDPKRPNAVVLEDKYARVSLKAFDSMLRFFYYGEQQIEMLSACELLPFAKDFKLVKLCTLLEKIIGGQEVSIPTCLFVLDVAYNPLMGENVGLQQRLKQEGLDFAVSNMDKIDFKPLEFMSPQISSHVLQRLQQTVGSKWSSLAGPQGWSGTASKGKKGANGSDGDTESADKATADADDKKATKKGTKSRKGKRDENGDEGGSKKRTGKEKKGKEKEKDDEADTTGEEKS